MANKGPYSQSNGFSSSHVQMWELDHKEGWVPKNWCFQTVVLKTLESPLDSKEIKPVNPKGNQPWIFIGRTVAESEVPILRSPGMKSWFIAKDSDSGKDRGQEKGATEEEMVGWYHKVCTNSDDSEGQGNLACCSPWGREESDSVTEQQQSLLKMFIFTLAEMRLKEESKALKT